RIQEFRARAEAVRVKILPAILSLEGARALLDRADLLITGDTSIKHLANAPAIRVLELCLGPSDPRRTGIYKENSLILQGQISADAVTGAARAMLGDNWFDIEALSRQHREARWMRTRQLATGYWFAADVTAMRPEIVVDDLVARCAWKLALNRGRDAEFIEFGSESVSLRRELGELFNDEHRAPLMRQLDFLESRESKKVEVANSALTSLRREFRADLPGDIAGYRRRQIALEKTREHSEFKTKLIRTLKSNWTESL
nr:glycosyltransferase family 9 protein [Bdellovibrionales bacterium]